MNLDIMEWLRSDPVWAAALAVVLPLAVAYYHRKKQDKDTTGTTGTPGGDIDIPWAPGQIPILGHALSYRRDPSQFLLRTCQTVGPIFRLNLAGKHMIVVSGKKAQAHVAKAPERILSARQAVADLGFEETLGKLNVLQGTDLHKGIVKGLWQRQRQRHGKENSAITEFGAWKNSIQAALQTEVATSSSTASKGKIEFFGLIRRVMLRVTVDRMIGSAFWGKKDQDDLAEDTFLDEFLAFQDELEDVTAKAVVLPRWIALPTLLWPVRKKRERLQRTIAQRLAIILHNSSTTTNENKMGFWVEQLVDSESHSYSYSVEEMAELVVGLLFAAHKNPAIGAAQSYLMFWEHCSENDQQAIVQDAKKLLSTTTTTTSTNGSWNPAAAEDTGLRRLCLETLRLTAHSIGGVRTVQEDFVISVTDDKDPNSSRDYVLPKAASVGLTHIAPNLHPAFWGTQAAKFQLRAHSMGSYQDDYQFTTFSHGVHKCPGQQLALVMLQCTVATLLLDYEVTLPNPIPPLSFERATLAQRDGPVLVSIVRRNQNQDQRETS